MNSSAKTSENIPSFPPVIPSNWQLLKLKQIASVELSNVDKKSVDGEVSVRLCNYVDVYKNDFISPKIEFMEATASKAQIERFTLRGGDVLITKDSEDWRDIAVPALVTDDLDGVLCGYHLAHVRPKSNCMLGRFLFRAFAADGIVDQFRLGANGITRFGIGRDEIVNALFPVPALEEQRIIADFLDRKTARIDAMIAKKQRQIELLGEKRKAFISKAVSKGFDPTASLKPSGIPWLDDIPAHWEVRRSKYLFTQSRLPVRDDDEIVTAFRDGQVTLRSNRRSEGYTFAVLEQGYQGVRSGQLVIHSMDAFAGAIGVSESDGKCTPEYVVCDAVGSKCSEPYYAFLLREMARRKYIEVSCLAVRERAPRFRFSSFSEMYLPLPPRAEQDEIVRLIEIESNRLVSMRRLLTKQIEKLTEYRKNLISAAVTGKIVIEEKSQSGQEAATAKATAKANPYFRRTVFAAAIIDRLCGEPTFGHVKFQKCIYVAQHHLRVAEFEENYKRAAAGPYDNRLVRSIDSQLEKHRWFRAEQFGDRYTYRRLEKAGGHQKYFEGYFGDRADQLTWLLDLFRPMNTDQAEIVATLYAVWNDFLIRGEAFDDDRLVEEVLTNWDDTKKRFGAERWHKAIVWMREKGLVPSGFGKPTNADTSGK